MDTLCILMQPIGILRLVVLESMEIIAQELDRAVKNNTKNHEKGHSRIALFICKLIFTHINKLPIILALFNKIELILC